MLVPTVRRAGAFALTVAATIGVTAAVTASSPAVAHATVACVTAPAATGAAGSTSRLATHVRGLAHRAAHSWVRSASTSRAAAAAALPPDGTFIRRSDGRVFEIVGGAPLYVSTWTAFGGVKPTVGLTAAQAALLRPYPLDGTFVRTTQDGRVHEYVGSAPFYVSTWAAFGGVKKVVNIDGANLQHAGADDPYLATSPDTSPVEAAFGTRIFVRGGQSGKVYVMTGGAPQYVRDWSVFGGVKPVLTVDQNAVDSAQNGAAFYRFVRRGPVDGWPVRNAADGRVYIVAGGAPIYTTTLVGVGLETVLTLPPSTVDPAVIDLAGRGLTNYAHLQYLPATGTVLQAPVCATPTLYTVTAGVAAVTPAADATLAVDVDPAAIANAGLPSPWNHLLAPLS